MASVPGPEDVPQVGLRNTRDVVPVPASGALQASVGLADRTREFIEGINSSGREVSYEIIPKEIEALKHAMSMAEDGMFITALSDVLTNAIELVQDYQHREMMEDNTL